MCRSRRESGTSRSWAPSAGARAGRIPLPRPAMTRWSARATARTTTERGACRCSTSYGGRVSSSTRRTCSRRAAPRPRRARPPRARSTHARPRGDAPLDGAPVPGRGAFPGGRRGTRRRAHAGEERPRRWCGSPTRWASRAAYGASRLGQRRRQVHPRRLQRSRRRRRFRRRRKQAGQPRPVKDERRQIYVPGVAAVPAARGARARGFRSLPRAKIIQEAARRCGAHQPLWHCLPHCSRSGVRHRLVRALGGGLRQCLEAQAHRIQTAKPHSLSSGPALGPLYTSQVTRPASVRPPRAWPLIDKILSKFA